MVTLSASLRVRLGSFAIPRLFSVVLLAGLLPASLNPTGLDSAHAQLATAPCLQHGLPIPHHLGCPSWALAALRAQSDFSPPSLCGGAFSPAGLTHPQAARSRAAVSAFAPAAHCSSSPAGGARSFPLIH
jgi:hypothetical protein